MFMVAAHRYDHETFKPYVPLGYIIAKDADEAVVKAKKAGVVGDNITAEPMDRETLLEAADRAPTFNAVIADHDYAD